jgi:hypothetical protein
MFVIRLPNGNLIAPESAVDPDGRVVGDAYVEVGPTDPEYARLAEQAVSEQELEDRRRQWREGDEALRRQFEMFRAGQDGAGKDGAGKDSAGKDSAGKDSADGD